jgi:cytochrome o ubiquinol oxidase operon protein cyoD
MSEHHAAGLEYGGSQKTLRGYLIGFISSAALTLFAFALVHWSLLRDFHLYGALAVLALAQVVVQALCFLRLNASAEGRWNLLPFLFTLMIIVILAGGSLWIMYNLNYNMVN